MGTRELEGIAASGRPATSSEEEGGQSGGSWMTDGSSAPALPESTLAAADMIRSWAREAGVRAEYSGAGAKATAIAAEAAEKAALEARRDPVAVGGAGGQHGGVTSDGDNDGDEADRAPARPPAVGVLQLAAQWRRLVHQCGGGLFAPAEGCLSTGTECAAILAASGASTAQAGGASEGGDIAGAAVWNGVGLQGFGAVLNGSMRSQPPQGPEDSGDGGAGAASGDGAEAGAGGGATSGAGAGDSANETGTGAGG